MDTEKNVEAAASVEPPAPSGPSPRRRKRLMAAGVAAAIVVVAGAGLWVWHEQPSFCAAICHTPMTDSYAQTLDAPMTSVAVDKWGNEVSAPNTMMAAVHGKVDNSCVSCHVPTLSEQVSEAMAWASGGYETVEVATGSVLPERSLDDLVAARGLEDGTAFCMNEDCHAVTRRELADATADIERNPHAAPHKNIDCGDCHKGHRQSVYVCSQCHDDVEVPSGWLSYEEAAQLENSARLAS